MCPHHARSQKDEFKEQRYASGKKVQETRATTIRGIGTFSVVRKEVEHRMTEGQSRQTTSSWVGEESR